MPLWFAALAGAFGSCLLWHKRTGSRHLAVASAGLGLVVALSLPELFVYCFGWDVLDRYAGFIIEPSKLNPYTREFETAGSRVMTYCRLFGWIGMAVFSLGLVRHANKVAIPAHVPADPR
ncbi:hypothetical protein [Luteolibacter marinus]|uniref:hypothetical protein n=1 Tax=Luteolibacter marinus TaxID=2776705 RepID=UPI00186684AF|nr:hypothetical protein [Luteolibacter marinus]